MSLLKLLRSRQPLEEYSCIKFHGYPSGGIRFVARNRQKTGGKTDREKMLI